MSEATAATIEAARRGDRRAQGELLRALQDVWFRYCLSQLRDEEVARDATQETGLRFLKQLPSFRGDSQLQTWSLGIALNVVRETKRRRLRSDRADDLDLNRLAVVRSTMGSTGSMTSGSEQHESLSLREETDAMRMTLDTLPDRQREALVLRFFEDMSVEETATAMNCAPGTVKATVHQALRALRAKLSK